MKGLNAKALLTIAAMTLAACHHGRSALSADGDALYAGQTVYAKHATFACFSQDSLQQALQIRSQGDKDAFFAFLNGRCGLFDKPEKVKILSVEPGDGDQVVTVKDLDDASAPSVLWMSSKSLSVNH